MKKKNASYKKIGKKIRNKLIKSWRKLGATKKIKKNEKCELKKIEIITILIFFLQQIEFHVKIKNQLISFLYVSICSI